jgi:hypothetical protein
MTTFDGDEALEARSPALARDVDRRHASARELRQKRVVAQRAWYGGCEMCGDGFALGRHAGASLIVSSHGKPCKAAATLLLDWNSFYRSSGSSGVDQWTLKYIDTHARRPAFVPSRKRRCNARRTRAHGVRAWSLADVPSM